MVSNIDSFDITFYIPTFTKVNDLGGAQLLFLQVAEFLSESISNKINIIDSNEKRVTKYLDSNTNINVIKVHRKNGYNLKGKHLIICPLFKINEFSSYIKISKNSRVFFWNLGITDFTMHFALSGFYNRLPIIVRKHAIQLFEPKTKKRLEKLMELLIDKKAVAFMSGKNYLILLKSLNIIREPVYLPVSVKPVKISVSELSRKSFNPNKVVNIGYLGRFEKIATILYIINSISACKGKFHVHIIGWGNEYEKETIRQKALIKNVKITIIEGLYHADLSNYILQHIDMGVAMGLSLINFAMLKVPTVATEYFLKERGDKVKYKWFYNLENFNLATTQSFKIQENNLSTLEHFIRAIEDDYTLHSNKCYNYFSKYYQFTDIALKMFELLTYSNLKSRDFIEINKYLLPNKYHALLQKRSLNKS